MMGVCTCRPSPELDVAFNVIFPLPLVVIPLMPLTAPTSIVPSSVFTSMLPLFAVVFAATVTAFLLVTKILSAALREMAFTLELMRCPARPMPPPYAVIARLDPFNSIVGDWLIAPVAFSVRLPALRLMLLFRLRLLIVPLALAETLPAPLISLLILTVVLLM